MPNCKITIQDEVNIKISNLDDQTRKFFIKKYKFVDPTARYRPAYRLGRWDGTVNFFGLGGSTYMCLLPEILEELEKRRYEITVEDLRKPIDLSFDQVTTEFWGDTCWPKGHRFEGQPIRLREDQAEAANLFLANPQGLQSLPTSYGKTILCATLCKSVEKYGRTITIVPNKSLVEQTLEDYVNCGLDVGVYYGDRKEYDHLHTICTWQSLNILDKKSKSEIERAEGFLLNDMLLGVATVIIDECHVVSGNVLKNLLTQNLKHVPIRWGITGTIPKQQIDFQNLQCALGSVINTIKPKDLQKEGILSNCHINIIQTAEYREFSSYQDELKFLVSDQSRIDYLAKRVGKIVESGNTLILVDRIDCGEMLSAALEKVTGNPVTFISGAMKSKDRKEEYTEVAHTDDKILVATYGVAAVGISINRLFNIVLYEPGKSFIRVIQSIGRGLRRSNDKDFVNIYDYTASTKFAKRHLTERKRYYKEVEYPFTIEKVTY